MEVRQTKPWRVGVVALVGLAILFLSPVLPLLCIGGGLALGIWHNKTRDASDAGRHRLPMLRLLSFILATLLVILLVTVGVRTDGLQNDFEGYGSKVAFYFGGPLAFATASVSWVALQRSRQRRFWIPLVLGLMPIVVCGVALAAVLPWLMLGLAGVAGAGWLFGVARKRQRAA